LSFPASSAVYPLEAGLKNREAGGVDVSFSVFDRLCLFGFNTGEAEEAWAMRRG